MCPFILFAKIRAEITNSLFCSTLSPDPQKNFINELMSNCGYSKASAINSIKNLENLDRIVVTKQGICPRNLGKNVAIAHVLVSHPEGQRLFPFEYICSKRKKECAHSTQYPYMRHDLRECCPLGHDRT